MFPAQTSFIPITVALVKFVVEGGNVWGNYPYWYLGEVSFRYLTGPVVPTVMLSLQALFGGFSLFEWSLILIMVAWVVATFGWGMLVWQLSGSKKVGILVGILYLVLPWHIVSSLALSEVSVVVASGFGPWALLAFAKLQTPNSKLQILIPTAAFAILLLTNTVASIPTILGLGILSVVLYKHPMDGLKRAGLVVFLGGLLTLWWYDPGYWLKMLFAPSFGGRSVIGAFLHVVDLARTLLPVVLAFIVVVWKVKPKNNFEKFAYLWLGSFVGLTLVRFVSNIHFWLDWTSWFGEIEVGLALLFAGFLNKNHIGGNALALGNSFDHDQRSIGSLHETQASQNSEIVSSRASSPRINQGSALATPRGALLLILLLLITGWGLAFANKSFWLPRRNIENSVEWQVADKLIKIVKPNETVFLSGTSAFWLNAFADVRQVRGGADQVGLRPDLAKVVWEVRMGSSGQKSVDELRKLRVNYLVVHSNYSKEFYHDFENPGKFEGVDSLIKVYDENGDIIYRVNEW